VSRIPRLMPLVGIAIGGVLAVKVMTAAPQIWGATQAFAEDVVHPDQSKSPLPPDASILGATGNAGAASTPGAPPAICAPTAAELAKEAGLSPAELQVLQSLSNRRSELDQREMSLDTQVQLIAAAEAKLDSRIQDMNELKSQIQTLLGQADQQQQADQQRLVRVYEDMDPRRAAAAMTVMSDVVRLPIAATMKERKLAAILQAMPPAEAKTLTEQLAQRMGGSAVVADAKAALDGQPARTDASPERARADATASPARAGAGKTTPTRPPAHPAAVASNAPKLRPLRAAAAKGQPAAAAGKTHGAPAKVAPPILPTENIG
jgi:flagellar motility protein MotE (MotC chaperone)